MQEGPPRLVEQALHDGGHAPYLVLHRAQAGGGRGIGGQVGLDHLHVAGDEVERGADLVGHGGRHLPRHRELLAAGELAPGGEEALRALRELAVRLPQLLRGLLDLVLEGGVEVGHALEHHVEAGRHRPHLVAAPDGRPRGQVARGGALHGGHDAFHG